MTPEDYDAWADMLADKYGIPSPIEEVHEDDEDFCLPPF